MIDRHKKPAGTGRCCCAVIGCRNGRAEALELVAALGQMPSQIEQAEVSRRTVLKPAPDLYRATVGGRGGRSRASYPGHGVAAPSRHRSPLRDL